MKKLLLILAIVSASFAFAEECPASYQGRAFSYALFLTDAPGSATSPDGYTGTFSCNYGSVSAGHSGFLVPGTFSVEQPENFSLAGGIPGAFICYSDDPINCQYLAV